MITCESLHRYLSSDNYEATEIVFVMVLCLHNTIHSRQKLFIASKFMSFLLHLIYYYILLDDYIVYTEDNY